jgi:endo-1,4-beta-xylanase
MIKLVLLFGVFAIISCSNNSEKYLKDLASFPVGSAVNVKWLGSDTLATEIVKNEFASITAESDMKMHRLQPEEGKFTWTNADKYVEFSKKNNMRLYGHTLIWHQSTPKWVYNYAGDSASLENILKKHITEVSTRYAGKVKAWDVVNEALNDSGGIMRPGIWRDALGDDYVARAFQYAHMADTSALLFYNDYSLESDSVKLYACLKMIDNLLERGIPVHGIGLQMHVYADGPSLDKIERSLKEFVKRGLLIHISELDVSVNHFRKKVRYHEFTDSLSLEQKRRYFDIVKAYRDIVPSEQQFGITMWGFTDKYSWIPGFFKQPDWPCIYNKELERKESWEGFALALE